MDAHSNITKEKSKEKGDQNGGKYYCDKHTIGGGAWA